MGKTTGIQWCDATWNPWQGCTPVASGCAHCYMFREKRAFGQDPTKVVRSKPATFNSPLSWHDPKRIFVCSWSDFFHEEADDWRREAWEIMLNTPHHTYLIPTKRPERHRDCVPWAFHHEPLLTNVWLGLSVSTQDELDAAGAFFDHMVPAAARFLSIEPLFGPFPHLEDSFQEIDLGDEEHSVWSPAIDWVIVAGESGGPPERALVEPTTGRARWSPRGRACKENAPLSWVRSIRDQCQEAGVPFFFKGWGGPKPTSGGRLLDGREWSEFPESHADARHATDLRDAAGVS